MIALSARAVSAPRIERSKKKRIEQVRCLAVIPRNLWQEPGHVDDGLDAARMAVGTVALSGTSGKTGGVDWTLCLAYSVSVKAKCTIDNRAAQIFIG